MPRQSYVLNFILDYLQKKDEPSTTNQISEDLKIPYQTVARSMRKLTLGRQVKRTPTGGHAFKYTYVTHEPRVKNKDLDIPTYKTNKVTITPDELLKYVRMWATNPVDPKIIRLHKSIREDIGRLYSWAIKSYKGDRITDGELSPVKSDIAKAIYDTETYLIFLQSILNADKLWSGKDFAAFLLSTESNIDSVQDLADKVITQSKQ